MSFQPVIPLTGLAGWSFLGRTLERQQALHADSAPQRRATDHFRANIANATSAEALVNDRRLLQVALGAFGLENDIDARAFIRKVLDEGTTREGALSSRLADKRYARLAETFGYGDLGPRVDEPDFAESIIARYDARQFEVAVGAQNNDLRLALNLDSALSDLLADTQGDRARWFALMGNPPLRNLFETALGLPSSLGRLDIDRQLSVFMDKAKVTFGSDNLADFAQDELREGLTRRFLIRSQAAAFSGFQSSASIAMALLSGAGRAPFAP